MTRGVLLMAYGTPERLDQVGEYFTHIRGGRVPSAEAVERLAQRYEAVGGSTPLLRTTIQLAAALERRLGARGAFRVYVGMKHWHPFIGDVVPEILNDGVESLTALALAPHYSRMSIGGYRKALDDALAAAGAVLPVRFVDEWHRNPEWLHLIAGRVRQGIEEWEISERAEVMTLFSAHSLPKRIREWNDPYEAQLLESCAAAATAAGISRWRFAWQSAGNTGEPWLGPDLLEQLCTLHAEGVRHVLSVPIGFVADHLEVLYDIDHEARKQARELGMTLRRTRMPNADPEFVEALASIVEAA